MKHSIKIIKFIYNKFDNLQVHLLLPQFDVILHPCMKEMILNKRKD
jgi:hypothetical protein